MIDAFPTSTPRRWLTVPGLLRFTTVLKVCATIAALLFTTACASTPSGSAPHPLLSTVPPQARAVALDGRRVDLPRVGSVTLIDFWATSCEPCIRSMPAIEKLWRENSAAGLTVVGIAADDNPGLVDDRVRELGVTYPNVVDADGTVRGGLCVDAVPTILLFDRHGRLRHASHAGDRPDTVASLRDLVHTLLKER